MYLMEELKKLLLGIAVKMDYFLLCKGYALFVNMHLSSTFTDGFKPRRSIVFASFSAGEYGSVGATEWLEVRIAWVLWPRSAAFM